MCGISGYIGKQDASNTISAMIGVQTHRGPDASGSFIDTIFVECVNLNTLINTFVINE